MMAPIPWHSSGLKSDRLVGQLSTGLFEETKLTGHGGFRASGVGTRLQRIRDPATKCQDERVQSMYELFRVYENELSAEVLRWNQGGGE